MNLHGVFHIAVVVTQDHTQSSIFHGYIQIFRFTENIKPTINLLVELAILTEVVMYIIAYILYRVMILCETLINIVIM